MLYLSRKIGDRSSSNNAIELTVIEVRGKTVKLGFTFPPDATVLRKEIYDKIMAENINASGEQKRRRLPRKRLRPLAFRHAPRAGQQAMSDKPTIDIKDSTSEGASAKEPAIAKADALEYDRGKDASPRVTASGRGALAEQILQIAFALGIKVRERRRAGSTCSRCSKSIRPFRSKPSPPVAENLAYVYKANAGAKQRRAES
ncbi:MAG: carbon storage regulator [Alphaproteobacteria bacterium]